MICPCAQPTKCPARTVHGLYVCPSLGTIFGPVVTNDAQGIRYEDEQVVSDTHAEIDESAIAVRRLVKADARRIYDIYDTRVLEVVRSTMTTAREHQLLPFVAEITRLWSLYAARAAEISMRINLASFVVAFLYHARDGYWFKNKQISAPHTALITLLPDTESVAKHIHIHKTPRRTASCKDGQLAINAVLDHLCGCNKARRVIKLRNNDVASMIADTFCFKTIDLTPGHDDDSVSSVSTRHTPSESTDTTTRARARLPVLRGELESVLLLI